MCAFWAHQIWYQIICLSAAFHLLLQSVLCVTCLMDDALLVLSCDHWVQVRQHTEHKRTFMFLEQVILKYNAAGTCINIKDIHEVCNVSYLRPVSWTDRSTVTHPYVARLFGARIAD